MCLMSHLKILYFSWCQKKTLKRKDTTVLLCDRGDLIVGVSAPSVSKKSPTDLRLVLTFLIKVECLQIKAKETAPTI